MLFYVPDSDAYRSYKPHYVYHPIELHSQPQPLVYSYYDPAASFRAAAEEEAMRKLAAEQERRRQEAVAAESRRRAQAGTRLWALAQAQAQARPRPCTCSHSQSSRPQNVFGDFALLNLPFVVSQYPGDREEGGGNGGSFDKNEQQQESIGGGYAGYECPRCHCQICPQMKAGQRHSTPASHSSPRMETEMAFSKPWTQGPKSRMGKRGVKSTSSSNQASGAPTVRFAIPVTSPIDVDVPAKPVASPEARMETTTGNVNPTSDASFLQTEQGKDQAKERDVSDVDTDTADESEISPTRLSAALADISALTTRFTALREAFVMPFTLDFEDRNLEQAVHPGLAYNKNTAPIHVYLHDLMELLQSADAVESHGDRSVRAARRAVVRSVEAELERVDREITKVWESIRVQGVLQPEENTEMAIEPGFTEAAVDGIPTPLPEAGTEAVQMDVELELRNTTTTEVATGQDSNNTSDSDCNGTGVEIEGPQLETEVPTEIEAEAKSTTTISAMEVSLDAPTPVTIASEDEKAINIQLVDQERSVNFNSENITMSLEPTTATELEMEVDSEIDILPSSLSSPLQENKGGSVNAGVQDSEFAAQGISLPRSPLGLYVSLPRSSGLPSRSSTPISTPSDLAELEAYEPESILPQKRSKTDDEEEENESLSAGYDNVRVEDVRKEMEEEEVLVERALSPSSSLNVDSGNLSSSNVVPTVTPSSPDKSASTPDSAPKSDIENQVSTSTPAAVQRHILTSEDDESHSSQDVEDVPIRSSGFLEQLSSSVVTTIPSVQILNTTVGEGDEFVLV